MKMHATDPDVMRHVGLQEPTGKERFRIFSAGANVQLAEACAKAVGKKLAPLTLREFPDGEIDIKVECDVRGADVFIVQPTCPPVHDNLFRLLSLIDCLRRASAERITAVIPYFGYARKDRKDEGRVPINAKLVANLITSAGADRVVALDLHAAQIQGFFDIPVDHLFGRPVLMRAVREFVLDRPIVVSPDVGGTKLARAYAKELGCEIAIVDKRRVGPKQVVVENVVGDVADKNVILVDDMVATGGSIAGAATIVKSKGARTVSIVATHAVLAGDAVAKLDACPADRIVFTDSIPHDKDALPKRAVQVSVDKLLAEAIARIHCDESLSIMFDSSQDRADR